ncbi:uncharacterized protein LOC105695984 isoform X2 [Orussus abietinus]|nr:uncharacterized protein LOC105695984 isoform X2 [Orussus abietinus]
MAANALEERINKIRQQNEEIRRRHEEVEADKKYAAQLNALVQMVPSTDWPERKEPPEFSNPPKSNQKPKPMSKEYNAEYVQHYAGGGDGKKIHTFAQGEGPPPDPKYNFLADSEREEHNLEDGRDGDKAKGRSRPPRGSSRKRGSGKEVQKSDYRGYQAMSRDGVYPEYDAWRAERNHIDEARISRQRTAEGNWRREWDNDKVGVETESQNSSGAEIARRDHKEFDRHQFEGHGNYRPHRGSHRTLYSNRGYHRSNSNEQYYGSTTPNTMKPLSPNNTDERTVIATDKSIKVTLSPGASVTKGPVMSVKVSSPSIAGTGRVGPRQKTRVMYSSQSKAEVTTRELETFSRQKSFDEKTKGMHFDQSQRAPALKRKKENNLKSPHAQRKTMDLDKDDVPTSALKRVIDNDPKSPYLQRKDMKTSLKSPHSQRRNAKEENVQKSQMQVDITKCPGPGKTSVDKNIVDKQKISNLLDKYDRNGEGAKFNNKRFDNLSNSDKFREVKFQVDGSIALSVGENSDAIFKKNNTAGNEEGIKAENVIKHVEAGIDTSGVEDEIKSQGNIEMVEEVSKSAIVSGNQEKCLDGGLKNHGVSEIPNSDVRDSISVEVKSQEKNTTIAVGGNVPIESAHQKNIPINEDNETFVEAGPGNPDLSEKEIEKGTNKDIIEHFGNSVCNVVGFSNVADENNSIGSMLNVQKEETGNCPGTAKERELNEAADEEMVGTKEEQICFDKPTESKDVITTPEDSNNGQKIGEIEKAINANQSQNVRVPNDEKDISNPASIGDEKSLSNSSLSDQPYVKVNLTGKGDEQEASLNSADNADVEVSGKNVNPDEAAVK